MELLHKLECKACPLNEGKGEYKDIPPSGSEKPLVTILGATPREGGYEDDGPLTGESGAFLIEAVARVWGRLIGESYGREGPEEFLSQDFRFNNVVRSSTPEDRPPTFIEIESCRPSVVRDIERTKPFAVIGVGPEVLKWVIGESHIANWRGRHLPVKIGKHTCWFFPIISPAEVLKKIDRFGRNTDEEMIFRGDIERALKLIANTLKDPVIDEVPDIDPYMLYGKGEMDLDDLEFRLEQFRESKEVSIDIETTSKEKTKERKVRPYGEGAKILSISIGNADDLISVGIDHDECQWGNRLSQVKAAISNFLSDSKCLKIAHNLPFELEWFCQMYGKEMAHAGNWGDTLAQAFVLDPRAGEVLSLNSLCRQYYGVEMKDVVPVNVERLAETPIETVLKYNAVDVHYTHRLYKTQRRILKRMKMSRVYEAQVERIKALVLAQHLGVPVDEGENARYSKEVEAEVSVTLHSIEKDSDVQRFRSMYGPFNPGSDADVLKFLKKILGKKVSNTDKQVLDSIGTPVCKDISTYRETSKLLSTYVLQFQDGGKYVWSDGNIHTQYQTCFTRTRRLSSRSPNLQNFPKRKYAKIRSQVKPPKGHKVVSVDYGQIEARVIAMVTKDVQFVDAIWNDLDVHMLWAKRIASEYSKILKAMERLAPDKDPMKTLRQETKNKLVFPAFFGSSASSMSDNFNVPLGVMERILEEFWDTYRGVKRWHKHVKEFYRTHGYVELLTGFRRYAPVDYNAIINTPIQGTSSDIVVNAMNRLSRHAHDTGQWQFQPRLQIHDDLTFFIPEASLEDDLMLIVEKMCVTPIDDFDFVNVPISVEASIGDNWYELEEVLVANSTDFGRGR